jgi:hypothetical protein
MAYLIRIGAFPENVSGVGSRGYHAFRQGRRVVTIWGGIDVRNRTFYWAYTTQHKIYVRASERAAAKFLKDILRRLMNGEGYSKLPTRARIRRTTKSARNIRRKSVRKPADDVYGQGSRA